MATTFTCFRELPLELRRQIWEATFDSRIIRLHCEAIEVNEQQQRRQQRQQPPRFNFLLTDYPEPSFERDQTRSRQQNHLDFRFLNRARNFTAYLTVHGNEPQAVSALSVCRESRDVARYIAVGGRYRSWKMFNSRGEVMELMWDPKIDVIDFIDEMAPSAFTGTAPNPLALFEKQFPIEVKEVQYLALPTSHWAKNKHRYVDAVWPLIDFTSLKELAVVVNLVHEKHCIKSLGQAAGGTNTDARPWTIPEDLEQNIDDLRIHYEKFGPEYQPLGKKPTVRVATNRAGVLNSQDRHIMLRCLPCSFLKEGLETHV